MISIPSHESLDADDSGSYSGSNSISGSNLDSDSDSDFDFDFTKDFGVYMDLDFIHKVFGLKISSDSGSASDSGSTSNSGFDNKYQILQKMIGCTVSHLQI